MIELSFLSNGFMLTLADLLQVCPKDKPLEKKRSFNGGIDVMEKPLKFQNHDGFRFVYINDHFFCAWSALQWYHRINHLVFSHLLDGCLLRLVRKQRSPMKSMNARKMIKGI